MLTSVDRECNFNLWIYIFLKIYSLSLLYCYCLLLRENCGVYDGDNSVRTVDKPNNWTRAYDSSFWSKFYGPIKKKTLFYSNFSHLCEAQKSCSIFSSRGWTGTYASSVALTDIFLVLWTGIDLMPMRIQLSIWCLSRSGYWSYLKLYTCGI